MGILHRDVPEVVADLVRRVESLEGLAAAMPATEADRVTELEDSLRIARTTAENKNDIIRQRDNEISKLKKAAAEPVANHSGKPDSSEEPVAFRALAWGVMLPNGGGLYDHFDFEHEAVAVCESVRNVDGVEATVVALIADPRAVSGSQSALPPGARFVG